MIFVKSRKLVCLPLLSKKALERKYGDIGGVKKAFPGYKYKITMILKFCKGVEPLFQSKN